MTVEFKYKKNLFLFDENTGTITGYTGTELNVVIPETIKGINVVKIGDEAFKNKELQSVVLPNTIESIGNYAFYGNELQSVILPTNLISIGDNGFGDNRLKSVIIPNSVTDIGRFAFYENLLEEVHIPDGVTTIGAGAFQNNNLETVTIPNSITIIENVTFAENQLKSVVIPDSVTSIKGQAFAYNELKSMIIPNSVRSIEINALNDNPLEYISISRHTGEIEDAYVTIPSSAIIVTEKYSVAYSWAKYKGMTIQLIGKTATFDLNGGEGHFPSHTVGLGSPLIKPKTNPTKKGAVFKNWITGQGSVYDFRNVTEDITIFAEWEETIPDTATIVVNHIDVDTEAVLETDTLTEELGTYTINAIEIEGYTLADDASKPVTLATKDETVTVGFNYKKNPLVESVAPLADIPVSYGTERSALPLPTKVEVTLSDGNSYNLGVTWGNGTPEYNGNTAGAYIFTGTLSGEVSNPSGLTAQVKVVVKPKSTDPTEPDIGAPTWSNDSALTISGISQTSVKLTWPSAIDSTGVTGYRMYIDSTEYQTVTGSVYEQVVTGLKAGTTYTFAIKAFNSAGKESAALRAVVTTLAVTPEPPEPNVPPVRPPVTPTPPSIPSAPVTPPEPTKPPALEPGEMNPPSTEPTVTFTDIRGHWAESEIKQAIARNIVQGHPDSTFRPNNPTSRAEFVVMLIRALGLTGEGAKLQFTDNDKIGTWAQEAIAIAVKEGILNGFQDGTFRPAAQITRAEMAVMVARALKLSIDGTSTSHFADASEIPSWAKGMVEALASLGIIKGREDNIFASFATATRAEAVVMMMRIIKLGEIDK